MIWFKFQSHDYSDFHPTIGFKLFTDREQALKWEKHMNAEYSGGTTTLLGYASQEEVLDYINTNHMVLDDLTLSEVHNTNYYAKGN